LRRAVIGTSMAAPVIAAVIWMDALPMFQMQ
jgi:hypothetical protein